MSQPALVPCDQHGSEMYCYLQRDGSHISPKKCLCKGANYSPQCPVDLHREASARVKSFLPTPRGTSTGASNQQNAGSA